MRSSPTLDRYVELLLGGNRVGSRELVHGQIALVSDVTEIYQNLLWPAMERVEQLFRADRISVASEHMATRINRSVADQLQVHLPKSPSNVKRIIITCADGEPEELGAQMTADLFESQGWETYFLGGGVPNDETLSLVGQHRPEILFIFGTQPAGVPGVRQLIDMIREVGAHPSMNILVAGGVFNRADGLWKEVHADLFARNAAEAIPLAAAAKPRPPEVRSPGQPKKRRRRRRTGLAGAAHT